MSKRKKAKSGIAASPGTNKRNGKTRLRRQSAKNAVSMGKAKLIENIRQIISEAPDIRVEKVAALQEAVKQGTYVIDVRKLANILIAQLYLDT